MRIFVCRTPHLVEAIIHLQRLWAPCCLNLEMFSSIAVFYPLLQLSNDLSCWTRSLYSPAESAWGPRNRIHRCILIESGFSGSSTAYTPIKPEPLGLMGTSAAACWGQKDAEPRRQTVSLCHRWWFGAWCWNGDFFDAPLQSHCLQNVVFMHLTLYSCTSINALDNV